MYYSIRRAKLAQYLLAMRGLGERKWSRLEVLQYIWNPEIEQRYNKNIFLENVPPLKKKLTWIPTMMVWKSSL